MPPVEHMANPEPTKVVAALLKLHGKTFAEELGIHAKQNGPSPLFRLLVSALLFSARISHTVASRTAGILFHKSWITPERMAASTWSQRVRALDAGGYARYDERTSTMLGETSQMLIDLYQGDLRKLRAAAGADPSRERELLDQFKGIGNVGIDIFFREAQLAWPEIFPFADEKALRSARRFGLPSEAHKLASLVKTRRNFVRLIAALVRVELNHTQQDVLAAARAM